MYTFSLTICVVYTIPFFVYTFFVSCASRIGDIAARFGMVSALAAAAAPQKRLHNNHGKPCANILCKATLVTGRIHAGIYCDRNQCGPRGLAGELTAKRRAEKAQQQKPAKLMRAAAAVDTDDAKGLATIAASGILPQESCIPADDDDADTLPTVEEQRRLHRMTAAELDAEASSLQEQHDTALREADQLARQLQLVRVVQCLKAGNTAPGVKRVPFEPSKAAALPQAVAQHKTSAGTAPVAHATVTLSPTLAPRPESQPQPDAQPLQPYNKLVHIVRVANKKARGKRRRTGMRNAV